MPNNHKKSWDKFSLKYKLRNPRHYLWLSSKFNAKKRELEFSITEEDIEIPAVCPVLGIPIIIQQSKSPNSPSIDRFDNSKGYTKENINVISWRANELKRNGTLEEFKKLVQWMENNGKSSKKL